MSMTSLMMHALVFASFALAANAATVPTLLPRTIPKGCEPAYESIQMVEFNDGPTDSGEAGIGAEFETIAVQFSQDGCSLKDTFQAKRKEIKDHAGKNYVLSADTSVEQGAGKLSAEYVLDGRKILVGKGDAATAGKAAYQDLLDWDLKDQESDNQVTIEDYPECDGPWTVRGIKKDTKRDAIYWFPQVTTSMPLEALYSLMTENVQRGFDDKSDGRNILDGLGTVSTGQNIQLVTKEYFRSVSAIDQGDINDSLLGFCSLVLSYAKAANKRVDPNDPNTVERSPKSWIPFMPRTDFVTIYGAVKSKFPPGGEGELFKIFDVLACYKTELDENNKLAVSIDSDYCTGTKDAPITGDKFKTLKYEYHGNYAKENIPKTVQIQEWIEKIDSGSPSTDLISTFDQHYDGSIGFLKNKVEKMYQTDRTAPLFEFRDLTPIFSSGFENFMENVDDAIQKLHKQFKSRPTKMVKVKREDGTPSECPLPTKTDETAATPTPTPKGTPCEGNQVQGDCVQGHFPPDLKDNSGPQQPICNKYSHDSTGFRRINEDKAHQAAADYCEQLKTDKVVLKEGGASPSPGLIQGAAEDDGDLAISVLYFKESCPEDGKTEELDFGSMDAGDCQDNFFTMINQFCGQDPGWNDYNEDYTLEGGVFATNCGMFGLIGQPG